MQSSWSRGDDRWCPTHLLRELRERTRPRATPASAERGPAQRGSLRGLERRGGFALEPRLLKHPRGDASVGRKCYLLLAVC